jgi:hypothetical protein
MAKFCPNCGNPLSSDTLKFCPECGTPIVPCSASNTSTPNRPIVEEPAKEKIYYQDDRVTIGNKMWVFLEGSTGDGMSITADKHIPVQAISSVDYETSIGWIMILIVILFFPLSLLLLFYLPRRGNLVIYTNNTLSTVKFKNVRKDVAQKYLKPMLQCLQERQH